jgi:hypothetical protein
MAPRAWHFLMGRESRTIRPAGARPAEHRRDSLNSAGLSPIIYTPAIAGRRIYGAFNLGQQSVFGGGQID